MSVEECWEQLAGARRAVLATLRPDGRIDAVPVVFAVAEGPRIVMPIDTVKSKVTTALQRVENLAHDRRATLLADHYHDDWSQLWWVRFQGEARTLGAGEMAPAVERLAARYPQYRPVGSIVGAIELTATAVSGWRQG